MIPWFLCLINKTQRHDGGQWSASRPCRFIHSYSVPIVYEAGWAPEPVWTLLGRETSLAPTGNRTPTDLGVDGRKYRLNAAHVFKLPFVQDKFRYFLTISGWEKILKYALEKWEFEDDCIQPVQAMVKYQHSTELSVYINGTVTLTVESPAQQTGEVYT
jgi:hypothetical protein